MSRYVYADDDSQRYVWADDPAVKIGKTVNEAPQSLGRQLGLTARHAIEGIAETAQIGTEPIAGLMRAAGLNVKPLRQAASSVLDAIGLPTPTTPTERMVGDAARMVAGAGGLAGLAGRGAQGASGITQKVLEGLASNPGSQLAGAAGAGALGGASREAGGSELQQLGAALAGGIAGGIAGSGVSAAGRMASSAMARKPSQVELDQQISIVLQRAGTDFKALPDAVKQSLRADLADALSTGQPVNAEAAARLADFRRLGVTPTRGSVTLDPVQITKEKNLAKMAAASADTELHGLPRIQNENNAKLINLLNQQGAERGDIGAAGNVVVGAIADKRQALRAAEQSAWNDAKTAPGYTQPISAKPLSDVFQALGDEGTTMFLDPKISNYMMALQRGDVPFTPREYKNIMSMLSNAAASGGNEAAAAGLAKRVLADADLRPAGFVNNGGPVPAGLAAQIRAADSAAVDSIDAISKARSATRAAYEYESSSPLVRAALADSASGDPERIAQRFVIGGTTREARNLAQQLPEDARSTVRDALVSYLKNQAINGAADDVGKFSQSAYKKALQKIGEEKLSLFFSQEEIAHLQSIGRVASYTQFQPVGSAVNNSNSGALLLGRGHDLLSGVASKMPFGKAAILDPLKSIEISLKNQQAQNIAPGLLAPVPPKPRTAPFLPLAAYGGLLAAPE